MSNQTGRGGYCIECHQIGHYSSHCPDVECLRCGKKGHIRRYCFCDECQQTGHSRRYCPDVVCRSCGMKGHTSQDCYCSDCGLHGHNVLQCSLNGCSVCSQTGHMGRDCKLLVCLNCKKQGHHVRNCIGCWHCGARDHVAMPGCSHSRKLPTGYPWRQTTKNSDITCFGCWEKGHKKPHCPYKKVGHNLNIFRKLGNMGVITRTIPNRRDIQGFLMIDPSGKGYFVNGHLKQFHWSTQLGSEIYLAEHENSPSYIDFEPNDLMNQLYYYSPYGKQKLRFQPEDFISTRISDLDRLRSEVSDLFANHGRVDVESERESFRADFEDGHILGDGETRKDVDVMNITRVNIKLKHELWELKFSVFEARMPCRCGIVIHTDVEASERVHNNYHFCLVETARSYEDLITLMLKSETKIPLIDLIVDLKSKTERANVVSHAAMYQSKYVCIAEEVGYHDEVLYQEHDVLDRHSNILQFHGKKEFQQRSYFVFGWYESTLLDYMLLGNLAQHSKLHSWISNIVKGLSWLHEKGSHHGCLRPHNIVIRDNKAMLHGLTREGSKEDDVKELAAMLFYMFSGVTCEFPYSKDYIPSLEVCYNQLHDQDFEAYDLVEGLLTSRLQLGDVLIHPKFYTTPKRLNFIRVASDYILANKWCVASLKIEELADDIYVRFKEDPSLEGLFVGFITHSEYYGLLKEYGGRKVAALLRCFRSAYNHLVEKKDKDRYFGGKLDELDECMRTLYPRLVTIKFRMLHAHCKTEKVFKEFFNADANDIGT